ncbi:MAG: hypothetical protein ABI859_02940 [Pseudomonadota bacterium]
MVPGSEKRCFRVARLNRHRVSEAASATWNAFNSDHGSIADEFSSL